MQHARSLLLYAAIFLTTIVIALSGLFFFFPRQNDAKPIFLKVVGFWTPSVFNGLKKDFQTKNPQITIEYEQKNPDSYYANLSSTLKGGQAPDLFWLHSSWGSLLKDGLDSLPTKIMSSAEYEKTFYPLTKTDSKIEGTYRALPLEINGLALLYNKATLASANLSNPPTLWTDLIQQYVPGLTTSDKKRLLTSAIALGSVNNVENFPEILGMFFLQNQVEFVKNSQLVLFNNRSTTGGNLGGEAIDFYSRFSKIDKTWDNTQPNSIEAFAKGKTAMVILPLEKIHALLAFLRGQNLKLDFGVVPVPQLPNSEVVTWGSYWSLGVGAKSEQKEASWKLANFLVSKDSLRKVYQQEALASDNFGRAYPRVDMASEQTTNPYLAAYVSQAPFAKSWYLNSETFDNSLNDETIAVFKKELTKVEIGEDGVSALKKLMEPLNTVLKKYGVVTKDLPAPLK